jgi:perosamine synthetase
MMQVRLSCPDITEKEIESVNEVLKTPYLSIGPKIVEFEKKIADYIGAKYAIAVNSGTSALHLIIRALGIKEGDKVITTPFSFVASANCILFERAKPVFVDIDLKTLNVDSKWIEEKIDDKTKAILAVDVFGQPADWDELRKIAKKYGLKLIEDSAEAIGAEYKGRKAGTFGDAGIFAFYPNKQITTGEGGVIITSDEKMAKLCRSMRNQGRGEGDDGLQHERLGYNYRISDINCALGIAQLERLDEILEKREAVAQMYNERLKDMQGVKIPYVAPQVKMSWFVYVIRFDDTYTKEDRNGILQKLEKKGVGCGNYFPPIHLQPFYREIFGYREGDFPVTEKVSKSTIALPFYNNLTEGQIDYVYQSLKEILRKVR